MKKIDIDALVEAYEPGVTSMRELAIKFDSDHHRVRRVLIGQGVEIVRAKRRPVSDQTRARMSVVAKNRPIHPWTGKKQTKQHIYKNIRGKLRFDVSVEWLQQFEDLEKLKFLNSCIKRSERFPETTDWYVAYIERFWSDNQFNDIYDRWLTNDKDKYYRPTIDHIVPSCKGGTNVLTNLQFLSWFENRAKDNMTQDEWNSVKAKLHEYLVESTSSKLTPTLTCSC